jgi:hypothetical protein
LIGTATLNKPHLPSSGGHLRYPANSHRITTVKSAG